MPFFEFSQNNSGGSFTVDDKLCHRLFIEAETPKAATKKALEMGVYFNGISKGRDCRCCGDRWHELWDDDKGLTFPYEYSSRNDLNFFSVEEYAQYLADTFGWTKPDARIFYADGRVKEIFFWGEG